MKINIKTLGQSEKFVSITDINKLLYKEHKRSINISNTLKSVPENYKHIMQGAKKGSYIKESYLEQYLVNRRNIPQDFKVKILEYVTNEVKCFKGVSLESVFIDCLESFLKEMMSGLTLERQKTIKNKVFDFCISDKIIIEFDESHHVYQEINDNEKDLLLKKMGYILIRVKSCSSYGESIAIIYKKCRSLLF